MARKEIRSRRLRLERSCRARGSDWIRCGQAAGGIQLLSAWFAGAAFARHRHDTYAIGLTDSGIQAFGYRGSVHRSTPGEVVVLHPDEPHDGYAGTEQGFGYRIVYIDPARISEAISVISGRACPLPFVREPVLRSAELTHTIEIAFACELEPLAVDAIILRLSEALIEEAKGTSARAPVLRLDIVAVERARRFLDAANNRVVHSSELEAATGLSRFELARQFRSRLGTSPYRYSLMRRLEFARERLGENQPTVNLALEAGFSDQAHFTRLFRAAFGLTPARYGALKTVAPMAMLDG
ncbi:MAG: AraC family transcriptional regulator [Burkholderiales bacterium]